MIKNIRTVSLLTYLTIFIVFTTNIIIARELEVDSYGLFAFFLAILSIIEAPLIARGGELYLKNIGEYWNNKEYDTALQNTKYLINMEIKIYLSIFLLFLLLSMLIYYFKDINPLYLIILALSIPFQIGYSVYKSHLTLINKILMQSVIEIVFAVFYLILVYVMINLYGLLGLVIGVSISALLKTIIARIIFIKILQKENLDYKSIVSKNTISNYKQRSLNSVFRNFTQNGMMQIDLIILGMFGQPAIVALYKIAKTLAGLPLKAVIPVWKVLYPSLVKAININDLRLKKATIHKGMLISSIMLIATVFGVYFFGEQLIGLLYGEEYTSAYIPFLILTIGYGLFFAVNGWFKIWVALIDKMSLGSYFYTSVFILTSSAIFIFKDNIINVALGVTIILSFMTIIAYILGRKYE